MSTAATTSMNPPVDARAKALGDYRKKLLEHREIEAKLKECKNSFIKSIFNDITYTYHLVRLGLRSFEKAYDKTENDIKALQSVGQIIGEVLKQLDPERCKMFFLYILQK